MGTPPGGAAVTTQNGRVRDAVTGGPAGRRQGRLVVADHRGRRAGRRSGSTRWSTPSAARGRGPRGGAGLLRRHRRRAGPARAARRPRDLATQQAAASVGQGLLIGRYTASFARHGRTVGQVLLTVDDVTRRAHYRNAYRTLRKLLDLGARADRQRERHGGHRRDPVRRQRPAGRAGRRASCTPTCWCCSPTWTRSTTGDPAEPGARPGSPRCATTADLAGHHHRRRRQGRRRHRRHGHQGRGGPDRHRLRHPGGAHRRRRWPRAALAGEPVGTLFHPQRRAPAGPAALARPRHHARAAGCTSTRARCAPSSARRTSLLPAGITAVDGRVHRRRPGRPGRRRRRAGRPRAGQLRRGGAARRCSAAPPRNSPRSSARRTSGRSSTATTWCCSVRARGFDAR